MPPGKAREVHGADLPGGLPFPATGHPLAGGVNIVQPDGAFLHLADNVWAQPVPDQSGQDNPATRILPLAIERSTIH